MTRTTWLAGISAAAGSALLMIALVSTALLATALAQPPEPPPRPEGGPPPEHRDPLRNALDANHDFELDADEIAAAPEAIRKLDRDGDGRLDREELRPRLGPPPPRDRESPEGPPRPREGFRPGAAGGAGGPSPERFLERAKEFDADGDGKLDDGELKKMAEAMAERMRAGRGPGGQGGPPREGGDRPERPRRPE